MAVPLAGEKSTPEKRNQHHYRVAPANFLAFVIFAAGVGDGHFVDAVAELEDSRRDFRIESPAG